MSRHTTADGTADGTADKDERYEVLFTWDGGDSRRSIEDGLDQFLAAGPPGMQVRRLRAPWALLARHRAAS